MSRGLGDVYKRQLLLCPVSQKDILLAVKVNKGQSDSYLMFMFVFFLFQLSCKLSALFLSGVLGLLQVCLHLLHLTQAAPQMSSTWNARTSGTDRRHFTNTHMCKHTHTHTYTPPVDIHIHALVCTHTCMHTCTHTHTHSHSYSYTQLDLVLVLDYLHELNKYSRSTQQY